jgi:hypothetical protein
MTMNTVYEYTCDSCGETHTQNELASEGTPARWSHLTFRVDSAHPNDSIGDAEMLLCEDCTTEIHGAITSVMTR